jgi:hypothetical protein
MGRDDGRGRCRKVFALREVVCDADDVRRAVMLPLLSFALALALDLVFLTLATRTRRDDELTVIVV